MDVRNVASWLWFMKGSEYLTPEPVVATRKAQQLVTNGGLRFPLLDFMPQRYYYLGIAAAYAIA